MHARLTRNLIVTLERAQKELADAKEWAEQGYGYSMDSGPHAVFSLLLRAQMTSVRIEYIVVKE